VAAFGVRSQQTLEEQGWEDARGDIALDATVTFLTFGMVSAPASLADDALARGWSVGSHQYLPRLGPWTWPRVVTRAGTATPDLAGLLTQCDVRGGRESVTRPATVGAGSGGSFTCSRQDDP